jgi:hypothetical protein
MIATPSYDGTVGCHFAHSLVETVRLGMLAGVDVRAIYMPNDALIQRSRNDLVRIALESKFDDLIFIDADQEWKPEWVIQLLKHPVDCVGGAVRKKSDAESYNVKAASVQIPRDPRTGLLEVEGLGTGFLRLSNRALQALWDGAEEYKDDAGKVCRWIFDVRPINGRLVGEDIFMTMRLRQSGIKVYLDPTITCSHIGTKKWDGNFAAWLERLQKAAA